MEQRGRPDSRQGPRRHDQLRTGVPAAAPSVSPVPSIAAPGTRLQVRQVPQDRGGVAEKTEGTEMTETFTGDISEFLHGMG